MTFDPVEQHPLLQQRAHEQDQVDRATHPRRIQGDPSAGDHSRFFRGFPSGRLASTRSGLFRPTTAQDKRRQA